jgi:hypothetical protein
MREPVNLDDLDPLLHPFVLSAGGQDGEQDGEQQLLTLITEHAEPILSRIIRKKLRVSLKASVGSEANQEALELAGDLRAAIISELQELRANSGKNNIVDFRHYVAMKAYSAVADYFRARHPNRWRLKAMLRYHLKKSEQFAIWESEDRRWFCGLNAWRSENTRACPLERLRSAVEADLAVSGVLLHSGDFARQSPAGLLAFVFERSVGPVELDHLVTVVARIWDVRDLPVESYDDGYLEQTLETAAPAVDELIDERRRLERLWKEVCDLPALQRSALLLNLRDSEGGSVIAFIPHLGIASQQEIAELAGVPDLEFAALWNELPLDDVKIASRLGVTRQQVINLRKTARERLARRMAAPQKKQAGIASRGGNK